MENKKQDIYITTPIYYVNDVAHIGHAYTTIIADTVSRFSKLSGHKTFLLTGTDEHGQKIEQSAKKHNKSPQTYVDEISIKFKNLWDNLDINYDKFIRTTDASHIKGVQKAFNVMLEKGDIYKGDYEGHYCVSCESFFTQKQLVDEQFCPDCGKNTSVVKEESYFFRLSNYQDKLLDLYKNNDDFILPKAKAKEIVNFVSNGLDDLSISRTSFNWGIKLPNDDKHVMYVWLDALLNYITALGYGSDDESLLDFHPAKVQIVGKDILRFHAIFWPAFLMSLDLPLPKHIAAHGWWTRDGAKMSKSIGNVVNPQEVSDAYGLDQLRYFLLREVPFGQDGDFSQRALIDRVNSDLSNDLGNLLNRIIGMSSKYFDLKVSSTNITKYYAKELEKTDEILNNAIKYVNTMQLSRYLEDIWKALDIGNKSITLYEPWNLMKNGKEEEAMALVGLIANILTKVSILLNCVMPSTTEKIASCIGFTIDTDSFTHYINDKKTLPDITITKIEGALFPRIDEPRLEQKDNEVKKEKATDKKDTKNEQITIEQFFKTEIKVGTILEVEQIKESTKLLKLQIDVGEEKPRQIVAGIQEHYAPQDLLNTQVCVVTNLKPAKIMGILSQGMVLASKDKNGLSVVKPDTNKKNGAKVQ